MVKRRLLNNSYDFKSHISLSFSLWKCKKKASITKCYIVGNWTHTGFNTKSNTYYIFTKYVKINSESLVVKNFHIDEPFLSFLCVGVPRMNWGVSQPEERRCSVVWWHISFILFHHLWFQLLILQSHNYILPHLHVSFKQLFETEKLYYCAIQMKIFATSGCGAHIAFVHMCVQ